MHGTYIDLHRACTAVNQPQSARVLVTHNCTKKMCRYSSEKKTYEYYTHPFEWNTGTIDNLKYIPSSVRKWTKQNPDVIVKFKGGGNRASSDVQNEDNEEYVEKFKEEYDHLNPKFENCCCWVAAALLIDYTYPFIANKMINMMADNVNEYEWMFLCKIPKEYKEKGIQSPTLLNALQNKAINHALKTVQLNTNYMDMMLDPYTTGKYICQLETNGGAKTHVVGIDCDRQIIIDSCESHALRLSKNNLDLCCGHHFTGIKHIKYCYELIYNVQQRKK